MTDQAKYEAIVRRDHAYDGKWFTGVLTTGVFCLPSCGARTPKPGNVRFFDTSQEAVAAGLRPCLRCRPTAEVPTGPQAVAMRKLCRYIRLHADETLTLERLAEVANLSPTHLQRVFTQSIGISPRAYAEACRMENLRDLLRLRPAGEAIIEAGFGSPSRIYEKLDDQLGMTPSQFRRGGEGLSISYATVETTLGKLMLAATDRGLCFVQFGDSESALLGQLTLAFPAAVLSRMGPVFRSQFGEWTSAIVRHLEGDAQTFFDLPLDVAGTAFQAKVWRFLRSIPVGEVRSYGQVAEGIGEPKAVRAVATACARNQVALLIPCHRVIRGTGELGEYRWGRERKKAILALERAQAECVQLAGRTL